MSGLDTAPLTEVTHGSTMVKTLQYLAVGLPVVAAGLHETRVTCGRGDRDGSTRTPSMRTSSRLVELLTSPRAWNAMGRECARPRAPPPVAERRKGSDRGVPGVSATATKPPQSQPGGVAAHAGGSEPLAVDARASARRLALTTAAFAFSGGTTLVFTLVLVRVLSSNAYGDVARTYSLGMAVAQLTMAGLAPAVAREVANGRDDDERFSRARGALRVLAVVCGLVSCLYIPLALAGLGPTPSGQMLLGWALAFVYSLYFGVKPILFALDWSRRYAALGSPSATGSSSWLSRRLPRRRREQGC